MTVEERIDLLEYKIKMLLMMIPTVDEEKFRFFNFILDNDLSEKAVSLILKSLSLLGDKLSLGKVSDETKMIICDCLELETLLVEKTPTFKGYDNFIKNNISKKFDTKHLLLALKKQGIHIKVCDFLLEDIKNNK